MLEYFQIDMSVWNMIMEMQVFLMIYIILDLDARFLCVIVKDLIFVVIHITHGNLNVNMQDFCVIQVSHYHKKFKLKKLDT